MFDRQSLHLDWITSNQVHFKQNKKMFALNEKKKQYVTLLRHLCQIELVKK